MKPNLTCGREEITDVLHAVKELFVQKAKLRGRNLSILMEITKEGLIHYEFNDDDVSFEIFQGR